MMLSRTGMDLAGLRRTTVAALGLAAVVALPLAVGGTAAWSFGRRVDTVRGLPVAVVNLDRGTTMTVDGEKTTVPLGRELVARLTQPRHITRETLLFTLTSRADATAGLHEGRFTAVVTIPRDYSQALASVADDDPHRAVVGLTVDDSSSTLVGRLADDVLTQATAAAGRTVTGSYVDNVLIGFTDLADGMQQQVDGTEKLADGARALADGTGEVAKGTRTLATGTTGLATGATRLAAGATQLADGTVALADGTVQLADGTVALADGATQLADGIGLLATNGTRLATGAVRLRAGAKKLTTGAKEVRTGLTGLSQALAPHADPATVPQAELTVGDVAALTATAAGGVAEGLTAISAQCTAVGAPEAYCAQLAQVVVGAQTSAALADGTVTAVAAYRDGLDELRTGYSTFVTGMGTYTKGVGAYTTGVKKFAKGLKAAAKGADQLADGAGELADGTGELADGAGDLADGTGELADGTGELAAGTVKLAAGTRTLADGTGELADGSDALADGTRDLADGVAEGADEIPSYTDAERAAMVRTVTRPVVHTTTHRNEAPRGAASLAGPALPLALWTGALAAFFVLPSVPRRLVVSSAGPFAAAFHGWWPATVVGLAQAVLLAVTVPLLHLDPRHPWLLGASVVATAVVFTAVNQALSAALGTLGRIVSLALLGVQLAAVGGVVPLATAPEPVQTLSAFLPLQMSASLVQRTVLGDAPGSTWGALLGLCVWGVGAVLVTVWSVGHLRCAHARREVFVPAGDDPAARTAAVPVAG